MPSRHQIREVAVQLLYSLQMEGRDVPGTNDFTDFWNVLLDQEYNKLLAAKTSAIEHLTQDRNGKLAQFEERLEAALPALMSNDDAGTLLNMLLGIRASEHVWTSKEHTLFAYFKSTAENKTNELEYHIRELLEANASLQNQRRQFLTSVEHFPKQGPVLDPVAGSVRRLAATGERVEAVAAPLEYPDNNDIRHLRNAEKNLSSLREKGTALVVELLPRLEDIDLVIESNVENYSPGRLALVDKAVLRLGTYELMYKPELPLPIIISEAIEIATCFSGSDSARFVNGVLDKIGKSSRPS